MTDLRVTQGGLETLLTVSGVELRTTQMGIEVLMDTFQYVSSMSCESSLTATLNVPKTMQVALSVESTLTPHMKISPVFEATLSCVSSLSAAIVLRMRLAADLHCQSYLIAKEYWNSGRKAALDYYIDPELYRRNRRRR